MTNQNTKFFYVTAIEGDSVFYLAGPYVDHQVALARVSAAERSANDPTLNTNWARAAFMSFGTVGSKIRKATALGVI
jgi:hypothetical protein